jgi:hypothetical protein
VRVYATPGPQPGKAVPHGGSSEFPRTAGFPRRDPALRYVNSIRSRNGS